MKKYFSFIIILTWLFCQCQKPQENDGGKDYPSKETFGVIDSCMSYMHSSPAKAHQMLDSLQEAKLMTKQRRDYFHAMILSSGENQLDSALVICDRLLNEGEFGDDEYLEEEICVLASNITTANKRHTATLKYANRGIAICHGNQLMHDDEAQLMARVGEAELALGRTEQARNIYARARKLLKEDTSFGELVALISLHKKQVGLHFQEKEYGEAISICHDVINLVERFDRNPSFVKERPETMQTSSHATHDFANFYKCQMYALIARAYRQQVEQGLSANPRADTDSVKAYISKWSQTDGSQKPDNLARSLHELYFADKKAEFANAKAVVEELYRGDSLVVEYVEYLTLVAEEAAVNNDFKTSCHYLKRAIMVSDSIRHHELMRELTEQLSLNMVQDEQLARRDTEQELENQKLVNLLLTAVIAIILIAALIITILVRKNLTNKEIIQSTQLDLTESMEEIKELVQQLEESKTDKTVNSSQAIYERIEQAMTEKSLYLNPELDIKMLSEAVCSCRSAVSTSINSVTGKTFRQWLAEYRLSLFVSMLKQNPEESIDLLVMRCGYKDQSTFRRQFKATYGITAGEYRKQLTES